MDIAEGLKTYLLTIGDITTEVGTGVNARVYYDQARWEQVRPFLTLHELPGDPAELLGFSTCAVWRSRFSVAAIGEDRVSTNELADTVRINLERYSGLMGTVNVLEVGCRLGRNTGIYQPRANSGDPIYFAEQTYDIWHAVAQVVV